MEEHNLKLEAVLPRDSHRLPKATLVERLRLLSTLELAGDAFGIRTEKLARAYAHVYDHYAQAGHSVR